MSWPLVQLRRVARFAYGDSLSYGVREDGAIPVYGSNGPVGSHATPNTLGPVLVIGRKGSFGKVQYVAERVFAIDTTFYVDQRSTDVDLRWLFYALQTLRLDDLSEDVGVPGLSREKAYAQFVPWPPHPIQQAIAAYLDRETARIDALIAAKRRMVELLAEREGSLIHEITSRGLGNAQMADSGVLWLGPVPTSWDVMPIRRVGYVRRGASPRPIDDPIYFDDEGEYAWVRIADVTDSGRYLTSTTQRLSAVGSSLSAKLEPGSLFISIAGSVGKAMITEIKCCVHDGFVYFERLRMLPDYLYYVFRAGQLFQGLGKLGTQLNLNTDTVGAIEIPVPPLHEQDMIVKTLDRLTGKNNGCRTSVYRQIALLKERRQALITAAVTGELEIPGVAA